MRDPDAPLTETEMATTSLFLGDGLDLFKQYLSTLTAGARLAPRDREGWRSQRSQYPPSHFTRCVNALRHGCLYWLEVASPLLEDLRHPSFTVSFIRPTPGFEGESTECKGIALWMNEGDWRAEGVVSNSNLRSLTYNAGFPCGLCWVTVNTSVGNLAYRRPTHANLLWRITPELREWHVLTKYAEVYRGVFDDLNPAYYRNDWWSTLSNVVNGIGDPDKLIERFHKVTGLSPDMHKKSILANLDDDGIR
jgi:hypothetical protein